jgi:glycyl-tRNA synthetase beta chain
MAELLLELFSEEIPARMQAKAEADLRDAVTRGLADAGVEFGEVTALSGPRRLAVAIAGLPGKSADVSEEKKGPKVGSPDKAIEGFMRGAGLSSIDEAEIRSDPKKGDFYVAVRDVPGRPLEDIIAELVPAVVRGFHWPKSMRWGRGELRWVRPLQRILCVFDGRTVDFEIDGLRSGNETEGHRVHGRGPFTITSLEQYQTVLQTEGFVALSREDRRLLIEEQAHRVCAEARLELVEDKGLLDEVTGLAEWPVVILGEMDPEFLTLPPEVVQLSMRTHQKYFAVRDPQTGELAPNFVVVANIEASDGGKAIAEGNARVLSARLDDARFFWDQDKATPLEKMAEKLSTIDFKKELGTIADKVERVAALARELAPEVGANRDLAEKAARLAKADLVSGMVGEFPELQGVMGRYYALERINNPLTPAQAGVSGRNEVPASAGTSGDFLAGLSDADIGAIADAIGDHYKPQGPSDAVPSDPVSIAVALADKLDTLVGFWAIDEKPTGSKDPFALRRAALGVVRIEIENDLDLNFRYFIAWLFENRWHKQYLAVAETIDHLQWFLDERLVVAQKERGMRHDYVEAALSLEGRVLGGAIHNRIVKRVEALGAFLETEDGANLLAGYKRAANILKAEEKKDGAPIHGAVDPSLFEQEEERALHTAIETAVSRADAALEAEDFAAAMAALAELRGPVDAFFDGVTVNADDANLRANRLRLLTSIREALHRVADFTKISG